jgi:hypothetical protein
MMTFDQFFMCVTVLLLIAFLSACAVPAASRSSSASPESTPATQPPGTAWVAAPSAELPQGFPAPGSVGQIIVKNYPASRAAVASAGSDHGRSSLFYPLFNHIQRNHIAMSAPVELEFTPATQDAGPATEPKSMAFIYGDPGLGRPGPDGSVMVVDMPATTVVSIGVQGAYTAKRFWAATEQLNNWLAAHRNKFRASGEPRYLAYNSPFVLPFMRYGEVQIPVTAQR